MSYATGHNSFTSVYIERIHLLQIMYNKYVKGKKKH
jgi:hypothetical protein